MRTIIAGSRDITTIDLDTIIRKSGFQITEVVSGCCRGIDQLGQVWAHKNYIPIQRMEAQWHNKKSPTYNPKLGYDPQAGPTRNLKMAQYSQALIAIWDGKSTGTANMIQLAHRYGLKVYIHKYVPAGFPNEMF
jgi:hypothetical protein